MKCKVCTNTEFDIVIVANPQNNTEEFTYYFCKNCDAGFLFDIDLDKLSSNYNDEYDEYQDTEKSNSTLNKILDYFYSPRDTYVLRNANKFDSILDIGCGNGSFLKTVRNTFKVLYGSEYNKLALNKAKKDLNNFHTVSEDLKDFEILVDVISMWHVLEHIPNPIEFLKKIKNLMKANSVLILEVPNSYSLNFRIFTRNYKWISVPEHVFFYNEKSLITLLNYSGFEIVRTEFPRMFPLLFSKHFNSGILKLLLSPFSIIIFILSPFFKSTESIRMVCKIK